MRDLYYVGIVKYRSTTTGSEEIAFARAEYLVPGHIVEFSDGESKNIGKVVCTSLISKGSDDEAELYANAHVHEAEAIYHRFWANGTEKEEEENA